MRPAARRAALDSQFRRVSVNVELPRCASMATSSDGNGRCEPGIRSYHRSRRTWRLGRLCPDRGLVISASLLRQVSRESKGLSSPLWLAGSLVVASSVTAFNRITILNPSDPAIVQVAVYDLLCAPLIFCVDSPRPSRDRAGVAASGARQSASAASTPANQPGLIAYILLRSSRDLGPTPRGAALRGMAVPSVERGFPPSGCWSTMIAVERLCSTSDGARRLRRHDSPLPRDAALKAIHDGVVHHEAVSVLISAFNARSPLPGSSDRCA